MALSKGQRSLFLADEQATVKAGQNLGECLSEGSVVFLDGVLGAGKTTFCRGVLKAFGYSGPVKSPTYTLVEPYSVKGQYLYHFDLYRLGNPEELEFMGIRDYFQSNSICLVEWPSRGGDFLPVADLVVKVAPKDSGRTVSVNSSTVKGEAILANLYWSE